MILGSMRTLLLVLLVPVLSSAIPTVSRAEAPPIVVSAEGVVELFSDPSQKIHDTVPEGSVRAKYEGMNYLARPVKPGAKLPSGAWLRTRPGARARVIFSNGDQMNVGPASFMKIVPPRRGSRDPESLDLRFGMVRSVISPKGPRSRFKVRTASAVMGVRGTDFVVEAHETTALTLIRGSIEVKAGSEAQAALARVVGAGETAWVAKKAPLEVLPTSKVEFRRVLEATESASKPAGVPASQEIAQLEQRAREVTQTDLLAHAGSDEERRRVEKLVAGGADAHELNRVALATRIDAAPATSPSLERLKKEMSRKAKATGSRLDDLEQDPYGTYFEGTQHE